MAICKDTLINAVNAGAKKYAQEQIDLLQEFAHIDCETLDVEGNAKVLEVVERVLGTMDVKIEKIHYDGVGDHLISRIIPENATGKIIINGHLDTVFPKGFTEKFPPHIEGDWLYGLGTGDCKGGFVVSAYAVRILYEAGLLPNKELCLLYSCDEEQGSQTGSLVFKKESEDAEAAFVFEYGLIDENGVHGVVSSRRGVILGSMDIEGVEAHAGAAYMDGHSAIRELAGKIVKYYSFNDYEREIYYNVAPISGGRPNGVVAKDAHMEFCVAGLPTNASFKEVEENIRSLERDNEDPVCKVRTQQRILFPAMEKSEGNSALCKRYIDAAKLLGVEVVERADPCATDANYFSTYGVPCIDALGPVQKGIHTTDECILIPSVEKMTRLFAVTLGLMDE